MTDFYTYIPKKCIHCGKELVGAQKKHCSNECWEITYKNRWWKLDKLKYEENKVKRAITKK